MLVTSFKHFFCEKHGKWATYYMRHSPKNSIFLTAKFSRN